MALFGVPRNSKFRHYIGDMANGPITHAGNPSGHTVGTDRDTCWEPIGTHAGNRSGHTLGTDRDTRWEPIGTHAGNRSGDTLGTGRATRWEPIRTHAGNQSGHTLGTYRPLGKIRRGNFETLGFCGGDVTIFASYFLLRLIFFRVLILLRPTLRACLGPAGWLPGDL